MMNQCVVVEYTEPEGKARWGYLTESSYKVFESFRGTTEAEAARLTVYLIDGTTGDAAIADLRVVEPFQEEEVLAEELEELLVETVEGHDE